MDTKSSIFTSGEATSKKIPLSVLISKIKIDRSLKQSNLLLLLRFTITQIHFVPMRQPTGQRQNFFLGHFASILMLPACLFGMILFALKIINRSLEIC